MHKRYFLKLVRKHLKGKATAEEEQLLISYYSLFESEPDVLTLLSNEERQDLKNQMNEVIRERISAPDRLGKRRQLIGNWYKVAAVLLIGMSIAGIFFLSRPFHKDHSGLKVYAAMQNRFMHLPDGSMVIVMKSSKLTYSQAFDKMDKREVYLEGQAFFDIKHDAEKPFIVHAGKLQITVLGTAFNVSDLKGDNKIIVTVTRGKVSVADQNGVLNSLTPGQQIVFNKDKVNSVTKKVDAENCVQWKDQDLLFDDVSMEEAAKLLKERFKVDFVFTDPKLLLNRFTTTFQHDESLEHELDLICDFNNAAYTYNKERSVVTISNK